MNADNIYESIRHALKHSGDTSESVGMLRRYVARYGESNLQIRVERGKYRFYECTKGKTKYLRKSKDRVYKLARKRYCILLIQILESSGIERDKSLDQLRIILQKYEYGGLDLAKIVFTWAQYNWYKSKYPHKDLGNAEYNIKDLLVRSKSEKDIISSFVEYFIPFHYEEKTQIYVKEFVDSLEKQLRGNGYLNRFGNETLFCYSNNACIWNVPDQLKWMNAPGSLWKTYDEKTGMVTIYPDFRIMLADGSLIIWEHEGLTNDFVYRTNANERVSLMTLSNVVEPRNLVITYESDIKNGERINQIIEEYILPRLWW